MASIKLWLCERDGTQFSGNLLQLPTRYMEDWSAMALRVSSRPAALDVLQDQGVRISQTTAHTWLRLDTRKQIPTIVAQLQAQGIAADLSDGVSGVYQG